MSIFTLTQVHAAIIKPQNDGSGASEPAGDAVHHLVVHGPAVLGVGMAHQGNFARLTILRFLQERL